MLDHFFFRNICAQEERLYSYSIAHPSKSAALAKFLDIDTNLLTKGSLFTAVTFLKFVIKKSDYDDFVEFTGKTIHAVE